MTDEEAKEASAPLEGEAKKAEPADPLALKDKQIAELTDDLKRLQAEFDNFKKRMEKEWSERSKLATQRLMTELLPVLDSFDKALEDARRNCDDAGLKAGLEEIHKQLLNILRREGLREINADGRFDPFMHEALMREEREDVEEGKILEVFQKGYALGPKALRPTKVKVAKNKALEAAPGQSQDHAHDEKTDQRSEKNEDNTQ